MHIYPCMMEHPKEGYCYCSWYVVHSGHLRQRQGLVGIGCLPQWYYKKVAHLAHHANFLGDFERAMQGFFVLFPDHCGGAND
jgi:hypothetical protein